MVYSFSVIHDAFSGYARTCELQRASKEAVVVNFKVFSGIYLEGLGTSQLSVRTAERRTQV
jgi:hypothetical protein